MIVKKERKTGHDCKEERKGSLSRKNRALQLYIHDPAEEEDVLFARQDKMKLPATTSAPERRRVTNLLARLNTILRRGNRYVRDFVTAGEIFAAEEPTDAVFVIDADRAPSDAPSRKYGAFTSK